jgi:hypothetical protein
MGSSVTQFASSAYQIGYPASFYPFLGVTALNPSVAQGVVALDAAIRAIPAGQPIQVLGVSQGDIVLSVEEKALLADPPPNTDITFIRFADPTSPTGIMGRNAGLNLPGVTFVAAPETPYNTVIFTRQYEGIADWPVDQLNILADINAILGAVYLHAQPDYGVVVGTVPASYVSTTTNSLGATTTTYLIPDTGLLPILRPLQSLGVNEQLLDAIQVPLQRIIDSAYTKSSWSPIHNVLAAVGQAAFLAVVNTVSQIASDIGAALQKLNAFRVSIAAKTPAAETTAAKTPVAETPAAKTRAAETTAAKTRAAETPAAKTPAVETTTVAKTTVAETTVAETPAAKTPAAETTAAKTPTASPAVATSVSTPEKVEKAGTQKSQAREARAAREPATDPSRQYDNAKAPRSSSNVHPDGNGVRHFNDDDRRADPSRTTHRLTGRPRPGTTGKPVSGGAHTGRTERDTASDAVSEGARS